jgi:hypothetical protein
MGYILYVDLAVFEKLKGKRENRYALRTFPILLVPGGFDFRSHLKYNDKYSYLEGWRVCADEHVSYITDSQDFCGAVDAGQRAVQEGRRYLIFYYDKK